MSTHVHLYMILCACMFVFSLLITCIYSHIMNFNEQDRTRVRVRVGEGGIHALVIHVDTSMCTCTHTCVYVDVWGMVCDISYLGCRLYFDLTSQFLKYFLKFFMIR